MDVGFEEDSTSDNNQKDYYYFYVYNPKRQDAPNATIGHFAVNKHTADVWNVTTSEMVTSTELAGIQRIVRRAHHIDQSTIERYRSAPF